MTIAYIGFSNLNGVSHMGASNAGVALSDYTYSLLDSVVDTDYYVCQDKVNSRPSSLVFEIRQNKFYAILDSIRFFFKLKHRNEYDFIILYHSFLFLPLLVLLKMFRYKTILQVNEIYSLSGTHSGSLYRLIEKWIFKSTSRFIISTEALKPYLSKGRVHDVEILTVISGPIAISEEESKSGGGRYGWRPKLIEILRKSGISVTCYGDGWENPSLLEKEMIEIYSKSRINLGFSGVGYSSRLMCLKGRDFEVPMSGGLYLTQNNPELSLVYDVGAEILTYDNAKDCINKIKWVLNNPVIAKKIRENGRVAALERHTWKGRFKDIFQLSNFIN